MPIAQVLNRGQIFFDKNYGKVSKTIMDNLDSCGTEDLGLISRLVYGHIVSNTKILSAVESSYVLLAGLIPQDVSSAPTKTAHVISDGDGRSIGEPPTKGPFKGCFEPWGDCRAGSSSQRCYD